MNKMKTTPTNPSFRALPHFIKSAFTAVLLPALLLAITVQSGRADSATWNLNPISRDLRTTGNWAFPCGVTHWYHQHRDSLYPHR